MLNPPFSPLDRGVASHQGRIIPSLMEIGVASPKV